MPLLNGYLSNNDHSWTKKVGTLTSGEVNFWEGNYNCYYSINIPDVKKTFEDLVKGSEIKTDDDGDEYALLNSEILPGFLNIIDGLESYSFVASYVTFHKNKNYLNLDFQFKNDNPDNVSLLRADKPYEKIILNIHFCNNKLYEELIGSDNQTLIENAGIKLEKYIGFIKDGTLERALNSIKTASFTNNKGHKETRNIETDTSLYQSVYSIQSPDKQLVPISLKSEQEKEKNKVTGEGPVLSQEQIKERWNKFTADNNKTTTTTASTTTSTDTKLQTTTSPIPLLLISGKMYNGKDTTIPSILRLAKQINAPSQLPTTSTDKKKEHDDKLLNHPPRRRGRGNGKK